MFKTLKAAAAFRVFFYQESYGDQDSQYYAGR